MLKNVLSYSILLFIFFVNGAFSGPEKKNHICLNMIVKNESKVIERALASVKDEIDYWVIVDTGSTDGTQKVIQEFMKGIPGELHERPWKNFEHNRNEALALAKNKGDYTLFMDADEQIGRSNNFSMPKLDKDYYYIKVRQEGSDCLRVFLVRDSLNWRWQGVLHEELFCFEATTFDTLDGAVIEAHFRDGNRTQDPQKYFKDAKVLEEALEKDPTNARYVIFLAQSYHCAGDLHASLKNYQKRAQMGGRDEEVFWSLFQVASLKDELGYPSEEVVRNYCEAYRYRPTRAEPLFFLGCHFYKQQNYVMAYAIAQFALPIPRPNDIVHVGKSIYDYRTLFLLSLAAHALGRLEEARNLSLHLLSKNDLPEAVRAEVSNNVKVIENNLKQIQG